MKRRCSKCQEERIKGYQHGKRVWLCDECHEFWVRSGADASIIMKMGLLRSTKWKASRDLQWEIEHTWGHRDRPLLKVADET